LSVKATITYAESFLLPFGSFLLTIVTMCSFTIFAIYTFYSLLGVSKSITKNI